VRFGLISLIPGAGGAVIFFLTFFLGRFRWETLDEVLFLKLVYDGVSVLRVPSVRREGGGCRAAEAEGRGAFHEKLFRRGLGRDGDACQRLSSIEETAELAWDGAVKGCFV